MIVTNLSELRKKSEPINSEEELTSVYAELLKAYEEIPNTNKVGLAASQIGILKQMALIQYNETKLILVNPLIIEKSNKLRWKEGCLSLPGISVITDRYNNIVLENGFGETRSVKEYSGFLAIACQHGIDHGLGITILDRKHKKR